MTKIEADKLATQYRSAIRDIQSWIPPQFASEQLLAWLSAQQTALPWHKPLGFPVIGKKRQELYAAYWSALQTVLREVAENAFAASERPQDQR